MKKNNYKNGFGLILTILLFGIALSLQAAPGDLDTTFGGTGKIRTGFGFGLDNSRDVAIQTDNKIVVAAMTQNDTVSESTVMRYNADGSHDYSFGAGGKVVTTTDGFECLAVVIQADGKIIVAGLVHIGGSFQLAIVRYNPNGSLDTSFDGDGMVITVINTNSYAEAIGIQADGKILVAGSTGTASSNSFAIVRYNADGSLDTTFDGDGIVITQPPGSTDSNGKVIGFQSGGKFIVAGNSNANFALARYNANGSLDTTFSGDGIVTTDVGGIDSINAVSFQTSIAQPEKIVVAGNTGMARYNSADGSLDTTFGGGDGIVPTATKNTGVAILTNMNNPSRIILTGDGENPATPNRNFTVSRYLLDGSPDTAFGSNGIIYTRVSYYNLLGASDDVAVAMRVRSGKIVVAGIASPLGEIYSGGDITVIRYNLADGSLDATFGGDGIRTDDVGGIYSEARSVVIQPDGKTIVAGYMVAINNQLADFAVARYNTDGTLDTSFGGDGKTRLRTRTLDSGIESRLSAVAIQTDGKIVTAGRLGFNIGVARQNTDGTFDSSFGSLTSYPGLVAIPDGEANAIAIQADGKILVAAKGGGFKVVRLLTNGTLDSSFDGDGIVTTNVGLNPAANAIKIQTDGKIVVAGSAGGNFAVVRYNAEDGSRDTTFGSLGIVITDVNGTDDGRGMEIQSDGKIVVAGFITPNQPKVAVVRYLANGLLDASFDDDGKVITSINNGNVMGLSVALETSGKIIVAGASAIGSAVDFAIIRYNTNGSLDNSYGTGGKVSVDVGTDSDDLGYAIALDSLGRAVIAGSSDNEFGVIRLQGGSSAARAPFDFDGDRKTDIGIFRPNGGEWWIQRSSTVQTFAAQFGTSSDRLAPADFTGDGKTDIAFWRPSTGFWFVLRSEDLSFFSFPFGTSGDVPVPADYDGDGKADAAVFRPSTQTWFISKSSGGTIIQQFGASGDKPVVADYDGDGKADIAIYRPNGANGAEWWIQRSSNNQVLALQFGTATDKAVQGDYTGDGKADIAVWRPANGNWFILRSEDLSFFAFPFGANGDIPVAGDYDGDGKFDAAVFRPSSSTWFVQRSTAGTLIQQFGITNDQPLPAAFIP